MVSAGFSPCTTKKPHRQAMTAKERYAAFCNRRQEQQRNTNDVTTSKEPRLSTPEMQNEDDIAIATATKHDKAS